MVEGFIIIYSFKYKDCGNRELRQQTGLMQLVASAYVIRTIKL